MVRSLIRMLLDLKTLGRREEMRYTAEREVNISVDEKIYNEKRLQEFSEYMYRKNNVDELARYILQVLLRLGMDTNVEGVGYIKVNGEYPDFADDYTKAPGIEVTIDFDEIDIY